MIAKKICDAYLTDQINKRASTAENDNKGQTSQPSKKQLRRERAEQKKLNSEKFKKQKTVTDIVDSDNTVVVDLNEVGEEEKDMENDDTVQEDMFEENED